MRNIGKLLRLGVVIAIALQSACAQKSANSVWSPAIYHDLTIGVSTRDEVISHLGKPESVGREQDTGLPTMTYMVSDPVQGMLTVSTKRGILDGMTLSLKKPLTKNEIIRLFGSDYLSVRYDVDDCLTEGGTAPIYESPNGTIQHMEYRNKGIGVVFHEARAVAIAYVSRPFGPTRSACSTRATPQQQ